MVIYTEKFSRVSQYQMPDNQTFSHSQSIFDHKNDFKGAHWRGNRCPYFQNETIQH